MRLFVSLALLLPLSLVAQTADESLAKGIAALQDGRYPVAVQIFQQAVAANPGDVKAHNSLGTAYFQQYVPGSDAADNVGFAEKARTEFETALSLDALNKPALSSLASLAYNRNRFDEAKSWNQRVLAIDPQDKEALYTLGVITWIQALPALRDARLQSNMRPDAPGPITNAPLRETLRSRWLTGFDDAIANLQKALDIDPHYDDAMAYMNLLVRYRADLDNTPEEYAADVARADDWMNRALEEKKAKSPQQSSLMFQRTAPGWNPASGSARTSGGLLGASSSVPAALPPLPPPPPPPSSSPEAATPSGKIRVAGEVQQANLIAKAEPVYPPLAIEARISGTVRFNATIGPDGRIANLSLVSGHPLFVQAAKDAILQYAYKPTVLNGEPVSVITTIEVPFKLPDAAH